jgi:hypothetical protein
MRPHVAFYREGGDGWRTVIGYSDGSSTEHGPYASFELAADVGDAILHDADFPDHGPGACECCNDARRTA